MVAWTYYSMVTSLLIFWFPYGAILGIMGGSCYVCRCCKPGKNAKGMTSACCIHYIAFAALCVDIISVVILVAIGTFYIVADCPFAGRSLRQSYDVVRRLSDRVVV